MTQAQWNAFSLFRTNFKKQCEKWAELSEELYPLQSDAASKDTPPYPHETAVVYNTALDALTATDNIRLIVIGDNPGKEEIYIPISDPPVPVTVYASVEDNV